MNFFFLSFSTLLLVIVAVFTRTRFFFLGLLSAGVLEYKTLSRFPYYYYFIELNEIGK